MKNNKGFTLLELMIGFVITFITIIFALITIGVIGLTWKVSHTHEHNNQVEIHESVKPEVDKKL